MLTIVGFGKYKECSSFWKSKTSKEPGIVVPLYRGNIQGPLKVTVRLRSKEGRGRYRFTGKLKIKPFKSHIFSLSLLWHSNLDSFLSAMWLSRVWSRSPCTFQQRERAAEGWLFAFSWLLDFCPDWLFPEEISPSLTVSDLLQGWSKCLEYRTWGWETLQEQRAASKPSQRSKRQRSSREQVPRIPCGVSAIHKPSWKLLDWKVDW